MVNQCNRWFQIDPIKLLTNEKIEMSDWEVHDTCVTLIKDKLYNQGNEIYLAK